MKLPYYHVDAFTHTLFSGNPAGVCPLETWISDATLQAIAAENNVSETAFFVLKEDYYELRWFSPKMEIDLCGHATLASAHVIFTRLDPSAGSVRFDTKSGLLSVERKEGVLAMRFPSRPAQPCTVPEKLLTGLKIKPMDVLMARDYLVVYDSEEEIKMMKPDMNALLELDGLGVIVTAPGRTADFVSRFFAPKVGVPEDPVTGSSHCTLIPYWAEKLGKKKLHTLQLSERGGELFCQDEGDLVEIAGRAVTYLEGYIYL